MSRIVCNAGPLIALGILDRLETLQSLFNEVLIPPAVQTEIRELRRAGYWIHQDIVDVALREAGEQGDPT